MDETDGDIEIKVYYQCGMEEDVVLYVACCFVVAHAGVDAPSSWLWARARGLLILILILILAS